MQFFTLHIPFPNRAPEFSPPALTCASDSVAPLTACARAHSLSLSPCRGATARSRVQYEPNPPTGPAVCVSVCSLRACVRLVAVYSREMECTVLRVPRACVRKLRKFVSAREWARASFLRNKSEWFLDCIFLHISDIEQRLTSFERERAFADKPRDIARARARALIKPKLG